MVRLLASLTVVSIGAATVSAPALATHALGPPPPIILTTKTDTQRAVQESYCVLAPKHDGEGFRGFCADSFDEPPRRLSVVRRGAAVTISFRRATSVTDGQASVRVLGRERSFRRFALDGPKTRWRVRLRPGKYEIEVSGDFEMANGRFGGTRGSLGLHVRRAQPPPSLAGRFVANNAEGT